MVEMRVKSFGQFARWYVETSSDPEVREALDSAGLKEKAGRSVSPQLRRRKLVEVWTRYHSGPAARISAHFAEDDKVKAAAKAVQGKSPQEAGELLDGLVAAHGVRPVALALVTSGDKFLEKLGYDLVSQRGDEVEASPDSDRRDDMENDPTHGVQMLSRLQELVDQDAPVGIAELETAVEGLRQAIERRKQREEERKGSLRALDDVLARWGSYVEELEYHGLGGRLPLERELYYALSSEDLANAIDLLDEVASYLGQTKELRARLIAKFSPEDTARLARLNTTLNELVGDVSSLLSPHDGGPPKGGVPAETPPEDVAPDDEPADHPVQTAEALDDSGASDSAVVPVSGVDSERPGSELSNDTPTVPREESIEQPGVEASWTTKEDALPQDEIALPEQARAGAVAGPAPSATPFTPSNDVGKQARAADHGIPVAVKEGETVSVHHPTASSTALQAYFWRAFGAADTAGAYWLATEWERRHAAQSNDKEQEPKGNAGATRGAVLPSWAVLAAHLGLRASWDDLEAHERIQRIIREHPTPAHELAAVTGLPSHLCARLVLLTVVKPTLEAPDTSPWGWLQDAQANLHPTEDEPMRSLAAAVREVAGAGLPVQAIRAAFQSPETEESADPGLVAENIRLWLEKARQGRLLARLGSLVLRAITRSDSELGSAVEALLRESPDAGERVSSLFEGPLASEETIKGWVRDTSEDITRQGSKTNPLQARALDQVVSKLSQLRSLLLAWSYEHEKQSKWGTDARSAAARFRKAAEDASAALSDETPTDDPASFGWRPPWGSLGADLESDADAREWGDSRPEALRLPELAEKGIKAFVVAASAQLTLAGHQDWERELLLPALLAEDPPLTVEGRFAAGDPSMAWVDVTKVLDEGRSMTDAFRLHLERKDFLPARLILEHLEQADAIGAANLRKELEHHRNLAHEELRKRTAAVRRNLEEATIDHALDEHDRADVDGRLLSIEDAPDDRIGVRLQELDSIVEEITQHREKRRSSLGKHIGELLRDLTEAETAAPTVATARRYLQEAGRLAAAGDLPLADEYLTHAEQVIRLGEDPQWEHVDGAEADERDERPVEQFKRAIPQLLNQLSDEQSAGWGRRLHAIDAIAQREEFAGLSMKAVPGKEAQKSAESLAAYLELKKARQVRTELLPQVAKVLDHIGFAIPKPQIVRRDADRALLKVRMAAGPDCPLPEFGSQRGGTYDVVMVFGQPGHDAVSQILDAYGVARSHPIVLYMGRLSLLQRQEWSYRCRVAGLTALLVDELLLYFLATRRGLHLHTAVSCGIAWGHANPYEPQGAVPQEMFKGRRRELAELLQPRGSTFIYGGRQFGKSVLLSVMQRELHRPDRRWYAFYEDIRQIGRQATAEQVWVRVRRALTASRLVDERTSHDPERLVDRILDLFAGDGDLRVTFLFDESDYFLDADQRSDFTQVHRLKRIRDQSGGRFRVVFSGLHSVQRFERLSNQPFAHLGPPVVVGPLEPRAAMALVQEPLHALGFEFESRDVVLRILSYTNYHPALIQLFCKELVHLVRQRTDDPPFTVTMKDVETLYLRPALRALLVQRFEWTLDLDDRYRALVYAMILAQKNDQDGYRREFTPAELWQLAHERWPNGFSKEPDDEFRSYLEELRGLGVLIRMPSGHYRLRNGNVVRGLGSIEWIREQLDSISRRSAPGEPDYRQQVFGFDLGRRKAFGPLTIGQASDLLGGPCGVGVVFGSDALSIGRVQDVLAAATTMADATDTREWVRTLPDDCTDLGQLRAFLESERRKLKSGRLTVVAYGSHPAFLSGSLQRSLKDMQDWLEHRMGSGASQTVGRLVVLLRPRQILQWMLEDGAEEEGVPRVPGTSVTLRRWTHPVVKATLADLDLTATDQITSRVMATTGGWPWLLDQLLDHAQRAKTRKSRTLVSIIQDVDETLQQNLGGTATAFIEALGLQDVPNGQALLQLVDALGDVADEDLWEAAELSDDAALKRLARRELSALAHSLRRMGLLEWRDGSLSVEPMAARFVLGKKVPS
ncbi:ATP-binding protein [Limnochorda pilosa]|uniref:Uncharacterized protein n=1 Tax=Limnochorda pilosa TaxID=1555112 RepID=A0A0K2SMI8_LIMPI|nr:hypothetical protein [Limnochorda pilosa]BAS28212.1 hypothetical protein LIP_2371 [Limnochorda pilosa]